MGRAVVVLCGEGGGMRTVGVGACSVRGGGVGIRWGIGRVWVRFGLWVVVWLKGMVELGVVGVGGDDGGGGKGRLVNSG